MAKIISEFPQLPDKNHSDWPSVYVSVYEQLAEIGAAVPAIPSTDISRAQLLDHLQTEAGKFLKTELKKKVKPDYSGKTDDEQLALINGYHDENGAPTPINTSMLKFPFAPNSLALNDVKEAKK